VNLGGNIRCSGKPRDQGAWRVGVRHPFKPDSLVGTFEISKGLATATSGNYERFVEIDGKRYAHILDPRTGQPVMGMAGVTVVCTNATMADAMSTALYVMGMKDGMSILRDMPDCAALFIPDKEPIELWATPAFKKRFAPGRAYAKRVFTLK
jgi:thiamine biosynthesis lipoprotein